MLNSENNQRNKEKIVKGLKNLEKLNEEYCNIIYSKSYRYINETIKTLYYLKKGKVKLLFLQFIGFFKGLIIRHKYTNATEKQQDLELSVNYFSNERIVIYTVIFGEYDQIKEPMVIPDNCEFFIITDNELKNDSVWKKVNIDKWNEYLKNKSPVEKNRFFKMNPHLIFPQYKYSIYIDGSIKIVSDLTPLIYRIGKLGVAFFCHPGRNCIFDELRVVRISKKIKSYEFREFKQFLKRSSMPKKFGMVECGLIVREHNNMECIHIMEKWWQVFGKFVKRDQLLLPYILWKTGNTIDNVALLGADIRRYYGLRVEEHM